MDGEKHHGLNLVGRETAPEASPKTFLTGNSVKLGWSWGLKGLLDAFQFQPGSCALLFKGVVVLILQEGGGDLQMPHGHRGIRATGFIHHLKIQQH